MELSALLVEFQILQKYIQVSCACQFDVRKSQYTGHWKTDLIGAIGADPCCKAFCSISRRFRDLVHRNLG